MGAKIDQKNDQKMMRFLVDFGPKSALKPEQLENGKRRLSLLCFALLLLFRSRSLVALSLSCFTLVLMLRSFSLVLLSFSRSALVLSFPFTLKLSNFIGFAQA